MPAQKRIAGTIRSVVPLDHLRRVGDMSNLSNFDNNENDENQSPFDAIKHVDENGVDFWIAKELMLIVGYPRWSDFKPAVEKAKLACYNTGNDVTKHFAGTILKSQGRPGEDYHLSRFACYLVAMNGDPRKPEVAMAQAYFAVKTHQAEIEEKTTNQINIAPDLVASILRDSLSRTKLLPEIQELCILRGLQEGFPQLRPHLEPGVKMLKESTASVDYHVTPTELGKIYGQKLGLDNPVSAIKINAKLLECGFQLQEISTGKNGKQKKTWQLTKEGKKYGVVQQDKAAGHDKIVESVRWLPEVVDEIIRLESA